MVSRTLAGCPNCHYRPAWTWLDDTICDVSGQVEYVCGLLGSWVQHCVIIHQFFSEKQSIWCVSPDLRGRQWNSFILWLPWRHAIWILLWDLLGRPQSMLWWIGKCGLPSREEPWFWINATATGWGCEAMSTIQSTGNNWKLQQSKDFLFCLPLIRVYIYMLILDDSWTLMHDAGSGEIEALLKWESWLNCDGGCKACKASVWVNLVACFDLFHPKNWMERICMADLDVPRKSSSLAEVQKTGASGLVFRWWPWRRTSKQE